LQFSFYIEDELLESIRNSFMSEHETVSAKMRYLLALGLREHQEATRVKIKPSKGRRGKP